MLIALVVALSLALGPHPFFAVVLAVALLQPVWFLVAALVWAVWNVHQRQRLRAQLPGLEADLLRGIAAELEAGASVREALVLGAARVPALPLETVIRYARAGRSAVEVADRLWPVLPVNGRLVASAYEIVSATGARAAGVFSSLAVGAAAKVELERERRTLTAQARFSAWMVGGLPVVATGLLMASGRGPEPHGLGGALSAIGGLLIAIGGLVIWLLVRDR